MNEEVIRVHTCFTTGHYVELLTQMKNSGYEFVFFHTELFKPTSELVAILRHDVDVSVEYAYQLAQVEHQHQIRATYFFMISSPFYNLHEPQHITMVNEMIQMGHQIGLHYHNRAGAESLQETEIVKEAEILSAMINKPIEVFSIHRPSNLNLLKSMNTRLINAYSDTFFKAFKYISDSNHHWREGCLTEHILRHKRLYILIHPVWWVHQQSKSPIEKISELLSELGVKHNHALAENVRGYKRYLLHSKWED